MAMDDEHVSGEEERVEEQPAREPVSLDPDTILDSIVPGSVDWRGTVARHPLTSVAALALVGYLVGRTKGSAIMAGISTGLSAAMMRQLADVFDADVFDL